MEQLSDAITCYIFSYLDVVSLSRCRQVCRDWLNLLTDEARLWKELYERSGDKSKDLKQIFGYYRKLVALQCTWNPRDCSHNITINDKDAFMMQRNCQAQSSDAVRGKTGFSRGRHYWTVCWMGPNYGSVAVVGVATKDAPLHGDGYFALLGSDKESWGWNIPGHVLTHDEVTVEYPSNVELQVLAHWPLQMSFPPVNLSIPVVKLNDTIGVILDMNDCTLSFEVNGVPLGIAFDGLPRVTLYPAISVVYGGSKVKLVYHGRPLDG